MSPRRVAAFALSAVVICAGSPGSPLIAADAVSPLLVPVELTDEQAVKLAQLRVVSKDLEATIVPEHEGQELALRLSGQSGASEGTVSFALEYPATFVPNIPHYIGINARQVTMNLRVGNPGAIESIIVEVSRQWKAPSTFRIPVESLKTDEWTPIAVGTGVLGSVQNRVDNVRLKIAGKGDWVVWVAQPSIRYGKDKSYDLLSPTLNAMMTGMSEPLGDPRKTPLPARDTITFGCEPDFIARQPDALGLAALMQKLFPDFDFVFAPVGMPDPAMASVLQKLPKGVFLQMQSAQFEWKAPAILGEETLDSNGKSLKSFGYSNFIVATGPIVQAGLKDQLDYPASLGINMFKRSDYVWPFLGRWGYDDVSVAAFRQDLNEKDEGLSLLPGGPDVKSGTIHFWDYFEDNHGVRFQPADLGLTSWDEFKPVSEPKAASGTIEKKRNYAVYTALFHYEWLRQAQRFGRWAKEHGGTYKFGLNPEDVSNGGDYVYLTRLADAGTPFFEFFGAPSVLHSAFYNVPSYALMAQVAGKELGAMTEIGGGGHGQHYLAPELSFLYAFGLTASGFQHFHTEWLTNSFKQLTDAAQLYLNDRFKNFISQALGFASARREKAERLPTEVYNVTLRSSVHHINGWPWGLHQMDSFGARLGDDFVDFKQVDPLSLPLVLDKAKTIFYGVPFNRDVDATRIQNWLASGGKTLVTHSYIPIGKSDGASQFVYELKAFEYRGEDKNYADFLHPTQRLDGTFSLVPDLGAMSTNPDQYWMRTGGRPGELLVGTAEEPRLSVVTLENASRIFYIHRRIGQLTHSEWDEILNALDSKVTIPRLAVANPSLGDNCRVQVFGTGKGMRTALVWDHGYLKRKGDFGGYGDHLLSNRGPDQYDVNKRPYDYRVPGARSGVDVMVATPGRYRLYRFLTDEETVVDVGPEKRFPFGLTDVTCEQVFFGLDSPETVSQIQVLREFRKQADDFFQKGQLSRQEKQP